MKTQDDSTFETGVRREVRAHRGPSTRGGWDDRRRPELPRERISVRVLGVIATSRNRAIRKGRDGNSHRRVPTCSAASAPRARGGRRARRSVERRAPKRSSLHLRATPRDAGPCGLRWNSVSAKKQVTREHSALTPVYVNVGAGGPLSTRRSRIDGPAREKFESRRTRAARGFVPAETFGHKLIKYDIITCSRI